VRGRSFGALPRLRGRWDSYASGIVQNRDHRPHYNSPCLTRPRKARQCCRGGDPYRPRKRGSAPGVATLVGLASEAALQGVSSYRFW